MRHPRIRKGKPQFPKLLGGLVAFLLTLAAYLPSSPLRLTAIAASGALQRQIGSMGWQPNARAFLFHVPFHRQEHALSCEAASLRSALLGIGVDVSESELLSKLPADSTPKTGTAWGGHVWGDPQRGFVGDVNGRMPSTGYGVFDQPLKFVADMYASSSLMRVHDSRAIDTALRNRHPIIAWYVLGNRPCVMQWTTPEGKLIRAPLYEHTVVIVGYRGTADTIEGVYIIDPITSLRYVPWTDFVWRTSFFDHRGLEIAPGTGRGE